jgi:hypothetical protein
MEMAKRTAILASTVLLAAACGRGSERDAPSRHAVAAPTPGPGEPTVVAPATPHAPAAESPRAAELAALFPKPSTGKAQPVEIVVKNLTGRNATFGDKLSPLSHFSVVAVDGAQGTLHFAAPEEEYCECGPHACPDSAARAIEPIPLASGSEWKRGWAGLLRRTINTEHNDRCEDSFAPPPGEYLIQLDLDPPLRVKLPATGPIVVELRGATPASIKGCPADPMLARRAASLALHQMKLSLSAHGKSAPAEISACQPASAVCTLTPTAGAGACSMTLRPHAPRSLELSTQLAGRPSPLITLLGPDAVTVNAVRYH